jgi:MFS family permease
MAVALNTGKVPVALPSMRAELGLSLVQAGWLSSTLTTVALLMGAVTGLWVGQMGAFRLVLGGLCICALGSALPMVISISYAGLIACRILEGLGFMAVAACAPALVSSVSASRDRRLALSLWSAYMPLGAGLAMLVSPWVLPQHGWRGLWALAVAGLALALWALVCLRKAWAPAAPRTPVKLAQTPVASAIRPLLAHPLPWLLALSFGLWSAQHFALIVWMPTYLRELHDLGEPETAGLTALMLLACVPGNLLGGVLLQRTWPRGLVLMVGQIGAGLGALVYTASALPELVRYAGAVWVSFIGGVIPAAVMASSTSLARSPLQIGVLQGLFLQGAQLGQFVGTPLVAAVVSSQRNWQASLRVTLCAAIAGAVLAAWARRLESARPPDACPASSGSAQPAPQGAQT